MVDQVLEIFLSPSGNVVTTFTDAPNKRDAPEVLRYRKAAYQICYFRKTSFDCGLFGTLLLLYESTQWNRRKVEITAIMCVKVCSASELMGQLVTPRSCTSQAHWKVLRAFHSPEMQIPGSTRDFSEGGLEWGSGISPVHVHAWWQECLWYEDHTEVTWCLRSCSQAERLGKKECVANWIITSRIMEDQKLSRSDYMRHMLCMHLHKKWWLY